METTICQRRRSAAARTEATRDFHVSKTADLCRANCLYSAFSREQWKSSLIRAQRLLCGFSQTELANAIGVTFQQLQKYEKGVNRIGAGRLSRIADKLKVPVTFFYEGAAGPKKAAENINEEKMDRRAQEHFLALMEIMTSGRKSSRLPSIH